MKSVIKLLPVFIAISLLTGCNGKKTTYCDALEKNDKGETKIRLQQQWTANSGFAGEVWAMYDTDSNYELDIDVVEGGADVNTIDRVLLGETEFGVAGAEQVIQANRKGVELVVVGVINYKSLTCFISKKNKNITTVNDMNGKKIGTMEGTPVDMVYRIIKQKKDIKPEEEVPTNWTLDGFILEQYDIYPAFINDEPITLSKEGYELNLIRPENHDIDFMGTVYFCKKALADSCPEIVQNFVYAVADGWKNTIEKPSQAITYLKQYAKEKNSSIDVDKEEKSLNEGMDYYKGENGNVLFTSKKTWENMVKLMIGISEIKQEEFNYTEMIDNRFIIEYLKNKNNDTNAK
jgi:NitT/TauT family transport system substrate-binding protein